MSELHLPPLPDGVAALPRNAQGLPVPWFVAALPDGTRSDLRVADPEKRDRSILRSLCWVCGLPLDRMRVFIGGPLSVRNRRFSDSWMHPACAEFSAAGCPFLNGSMARRSGRAMPGPTHSPAGLKLDSIDLVALYYTTRPARIERGGAISPGAARWVRWWSRGAQLPQAEGERRAKEYAGPEQAKDLHDAWRALGVALAHAPGRRHISEA